MANYYAIERSDQYLMHKGVVGMRKGVRRSEEELEAIRNRRSMANAAAERANQYSERFHQDGGSNRAIPEQRIAGKQAYQKARKLLRKLNATATHYGRQGIRVGIKRHPY